MIVELTAGKEWLREFEGPASVIFASVSTPGAISVEVELNGELVERVDTTVPHSWWKYAGNALFPKGEAIEGDVLVVRCVAGAGWLRVDFE